MPDTFDHLLVVGFTQVRPFESDSAVRKTPVPQREREPHGQRLLMQLAALPRARRASTSRRAEMELPRDAGMTIAIEVTPPGAIDYQQLEWRRTASKCSAWWTREARTSVALHVPGGASPHSRSASGTYPGQGHRVWQACQCGTGQCDRRLSEGSLRRAVDRREPTSPESRASRLVPSLAASWGDRHCRFANALLTARRFRHRGRCRVPHLSGSRGCRGPGFARGVASRRSNVLDQIAEIRGNRANRRVLSVRPQAFRAG